MLAKSRRVDLTTEYISTLGRRVIEGTLDLSPVYQRNSVWTDIDRNDFLESIFKDMTPTNIVFVIDTEKGTTRNLDGKQRCETIKMFFNNEIGYREGNNILYYSNTPKKIDGARILTPQEKIEIDNRKIFVAKYYNLEYYEQVELFNSLNKGKILTPGEKIAIEFETEDLAKKFSDFFDSLKDEFKILVDTNRKNHNILIMRMLYNFDINTDPAYNSRTVKNHFNGLEIEEVDILLKKFKPRIKHIMSNIDWKTIKREYSDLFIENVLVYFSINFKKINKLSKKELTKLTNKIIDKLSDNEDINENKNKDNLRKIYNFFDKLGNSVFRSTN